MSSFCRMSDNLDTSEQRHLSCRRCWVGDHAPFSDSQYTITHKSCSDVYIKPKVKPDVQVTQVSQHCAMCRKQPLSRNTVATNLYQCLNRNCSWTCDQHHLKINSVRNRPRLLLFGWRWTVFITSRSALFGSGCGRILIHRTDTHTTHTSANVRIFV